MENVELTIQTLIRQIQWMESKDMHLHDETVDQYINNRRMLVHLCDEQTVHTLQG